VFCTRLSWVAPDAVVQRAMRHSSPETKRHYQLGMQFTRLITERSSKAREILKWRGMVVTVCRPGHSSSKSSHIVVDCNEFYVALQSDQPGNPYTRQAFSLSDIAVAYDYENDCLELRLTS